MSVKISCLPRERRSTIEIWQMIVTTVMFALTLAGCSSAPQMDYGTVDLANAGGDVTLNGQPLDGAVVTFEAPDGQFSYGQTDASGHYDLQFDSVKKGVTPGKKTVRISTSQKIEGLNAEEGAVEGESGEEGKPAKKAEPDRVPQRYNKKSELSVDVTPGQTDYDFELKSP